MLKVIFVNHQINYIGHSSIIIKKNWWIAVLYIEKNYFAVLVKNYLDTEKLSKMDDYNIAILDMLCI